jgi:hypothetical protein
VALVQRGTYGVPLGDQKFFLVYDSFSMAPPYLGMYFFFSLIKAEIA